MYQFFAGILTGFLLTSGFCLVIVWKQQSRYEELMAEKQHELRKANDAVEKSLNQAEKKDGPVDR